jgi:hypothetical protein
MGRNRVAVGKVWWTLKRRRRLIVQPLIKHDGGKYARRSEASQEPEENRANEDTIVSVSGKVQPKTRAEQARALVECPRQQRTCPRHNRPVDDRRHYPIVTAFMHRARNLHAHNDGGYDIGLPWVNVTNGEQPQRGSGHLGAMHGNGMAATALRLEIICGR